MHGAGGATQIQQYKQRLQQMHQQLVLGKQQLQELQKQNQQQKASQGIMPNIFLFIMHMYEL